MNFFCKKNNEEKDKKKKNIIKIKQENIYSKSHTTRHPEIHTGTDIVYPILNIQHSTQELMKSMEMHSMRMKTTNIT